MSGRRAPLHFTSAVFLVVKESDHPLSFMAIFRNVITRFPHLMNSGSLFEDIRRFLRSFFFIAIGDRTNAATVMMYIVNPEYDGVTINRATGLLNGCGQGTGGFSDFMDLR